MPFFLKLCATNQKHPLRRRQIVLVFDKFAGNFHGLPLFAQKILHNLLFSVINMHFGRELPVLNSAGCSFLRNIIFALSSAALFGGMFRHFFRRLYNKVNIVSVEKRLDKMRCLPYNM